MPGLTGAVLQNVLRRATSALQQRADELDEFDAKTGDGDMGATLASISLALADQIEEFPDDLGDCFAKVVAVIGATSGSSLSAVAMMGFHRMALETRGRDAVAWTELGGLMVKAVASMQQRSGTCAGDKTVIDSLAEIAAAISGKSDPAVIAALADDAAERSLEAFKARPSRIGRARLAQESGVGEYDAGMRAVAVVTQAIRSPSSGTP